MLEQKKVKIGGREYIRIYSSSDYYIECFDGRLFVEVLEPIDSNKVYVQTRIPIIRRREK